LIKDDSLYCIGEYYPMLEELDISDCDNITDKGIICIGMKCVELKRMYFNSMTHITEKGIFRFLQYALNLTLLQATHCNKVKQEFWNKIRYSGDKLIITH